MDLMEKLSTAYRCLPVGKHVFTWPFTMKHANELSMFGDRLVEHWDFHGIYIYTHIYIYNMKGH